MFDDLRREAVVQLLMDNKELMELPAPKGSIKAEHRINAMSNCEFLDLLSKIFQRRI